MCQMRVVVENNGVEELLLEEVTALDILENSVQITSLFEGAKEFPGKISRIDFMAGKVFLEQNN